MEVSQEQKGGQTAVLIRQLADWGMAAKQMHEVIRLPLDGLEEQVSLPVCLFVCLSLFFTGVQSTHSPYFACLSEYM